MMSNYNGHGRRRRDNFSSRNDDNLTSRHRNDDLDLSNNPPEFTESDIIEYLQMKTGRPGINPLLRSQGSDVLDTRLNSLGESDYISKDERIYLDQQSSSMRRSLSPDERIEEDFLRNDVPGRVDRDLDDATSTLLDPRLTQNNPRGFDLISERDLDTEICNEIYRVISSDNAKRQNLLAQQNSSSYSQNSLNTQDRLSALTSRRSFPPCEDRLNRLTYRRSSQTSAQNFDSRGTQSGVAGKKRKPKWKKRKKPPQPEDKSTSNSAQENKSTIVEQKEPDPTARKSKKKRRREKLRAELGLDGKTTPQDVQVPKEDDPEQPPKKKWKSSSQKNKMKKKGKIVDLLKEQEKPSIWKCEAGTDTFEDVQPFRKLSRNPEQRKIALLCVFCQSDTGKTQEEYKCHVDSEDHKRNVLATRLYYENLIDRLKKKATIELQEAKQNERVKMCSVCRLEFTGPTLEHRSSRIHQAMKHILTVRCSYCDIVCESRYEYELHTLEDVNHRRNRYYMLAEDDNLEDSRIDDECGSQFVTDVKAYYCIACEELFEIELVPPLEHCKTWNHYDNLKKYAEKRKVEVSNAEKTKFLIPGRKDQ